MLYAKRLFFRHDQFDRLGAINLDGVLITGCAAGGRPPNGERLPSRQLKQFLLGAPWACVPLVGLLANRSPCPAKFPDDRVLDLRCCRRGHRNLPKDQARLEERRLEAIEARRAEAGSFCLPALPDGADKPWWRPGPRSVRGPGDPRGAVCGSRPGPVSRANGP